MTDALDLATRIEAATGNELERLGWEAARVLLGVREHHVSAGIPMRLGGNPAGSLDACLRLKEAALPGVSGETEIGARRNMASVFPGADKFSGWHAEPAAALLAAMLRAVEASR